MSFCGSDISSLFPESKSSAPAKKVDSLRAKIEKKNFPAYENLGEADHPSDTRDVKSLYRPQGSYKNFDSDYTPEAEYHLSMKNAEMMDFSSDEEEQPRRTDRNIQSKYPGQTKNDDSYEFVKATRRLLVTLKENGASEYINIENLLEEYSKVRSKLPESSEEERCGYSQELISIEEKITSFISEVSIPCVGGERGEPIDED